MSGFAWIRPDVIQTVNRSSKRGASELAEGRRDGRIEADDGAAGPVHPGSYALHYGTSEQDVDPGIQDLVPRRKANPEKQAANAELAA